ncbi:MAG: DegT/DnrJ/EryC1/StrS family aminotransferase [Pyrinomonadaceae bacterium]
MHVPFVDLKAQYAAIKDELDAAITKAVSETAFISGRYAAGFESQFAKYIGTDHCVAVANGTDAIEIGLRAIGVEPGDEVLVPANTFIATAEGVSNIGATPVFVDVDAASYTIDPQAIEAKMTPRTKAIIPVHLYGLPAEMDAIVSIAERHGLKILEDCAQAHGSTYKGKTVGTFGDAATFSFYPSKNLGAFGDAGAIVSGDKAVADRARLIANHGQFEKNRHTIVGRNSRMDGIQAAVLSVKLPHLDGWLERRRTRAELYNKLLSSRLPVPTAPEYSRHTFHLYVTRVRERERVVEKLTAAGIETGLHYPTAIPFMEAYAHLGHTPSDFPVAYQQMSEIVSLPMYAELSDEMVEYVCENLLAALLNQAAA